MIRRFFPHAAVVWSLGYASLGLWWAAGGSGSPYPAPARAVAMGAALVDHPAEATGVVVALLGSVGALVGLRLAARPRSGPPARIVAACLGAALLLVVPDGRLLLALGELLVLHPERCEPAAAHQAFCAVGGVVLLGAAHGGGRPVEVPERLVCHLAAALPLLYAGPRMLWALGSTVGLDAPTTARVTSPEGRSRELVFAGAAVAGGLMTLGLVQRWDTRVPGAVPGFGGRRVPIALAGAALGPPAGSVALSTANWGAWLGNVAWLPWGLAPATSTVQYRRRRLRERNVVRV